MFIVSLRAAPGLAWTENTTDPFPVPDPEVIEIQLATVVAVHAQPAKAVTLNPPTPPLGENVVLFVVKEKTQPLAWLTVYVCPPAVIVPDRAGPVLAATEKFTLPLPEPLLPAVMVIHVSFRTAVQLQAGMVLIENPPVPPAAPMFVFVVESEKVQPEA